MQHIIPNMGILTGLMNKLGLPHDPWRFKAEITEYDKVIYGNQRVWMGAALLRCVCIFTGHQSKCRRLHTSSKREYFHSNKRSRMKLHMMLETSENMLMPLSLPLLAERTQQKKEHGKRTAHFPPCTSVRPFPF